MNKTLVGAVLVAVLIGLGGGFAFGYIIYQPQLQGLQDDLDNLTEDLDDLTLDMTSMHSQLSSLDSEINQEWHEVYSLASSSDSMSGAIRLKGSQMRAMYIATSDYTDAWLSIILHFSNGTEYAVWGTSGVWSANNAVLELPQTGDYYISITTYQTSYVVSFWDYY